MSLCLLFIFIYYHNIQIQMTKLCYQEMATGGSRVAVKFIYRSEREKQLKVVSPSFAAFLNPPLMTYAIHQNLKYLQ